MKIKYVFNNAEIKEVEVSEEIGAVIEESRRKEAALAKKEQRHCYSLDAVTYEGTEYGEPDFTASLFDGSEERSAHIRETFSHLTETQRRRILILHYRYILNYTWEKIAELLGTSVRTIHRWHDSALRNAVIPKSPTKI